MTLYARRFWEQAVSSQLRRNTILGASSSAATAIIASISYPVYLRFLGYEQYGLWIAVSIVLSLAQFGSIGLAPAVAKRVAEDFACNRLDSIRTTVTTALVTLSAFGLVALSIVLFFKQQILSTMHLQEPLAQQASGLLPFVAIICIYAIQIDTLNSILTGLGRLDLSSATHIASRLTALAVSSLLLARGNGVVSLPIGTLTGFVFLHAATLALTRRITGRGCLSVHGFDWKRLNQLATFGSGLGICSVVTILLGALNKVTIARYVGLDTVAIYEMAWILSMQARSFFESGLRSLLPEVSKLATIDRPDSVCRIKTINRRATMAVVGFGLPLFGAIGLFAEPLLRLWLGARFRPEIVPILRLLLAGCYLNLIGVPSYYTLLGLGQIKSIVAAQMAQFLVNAGLIATFYLIYSRMSLVSVTTAVSVGIAVGGLYCYAVAALLSDRTLLGPSAEKYRKQVAL